MRKDKAKIGFRLTLANPLVRANDNSLRMSPGWRMYAEDLIHHACC